MEVMIPASKPPHSKNWVPGTPVWLSWKSMGLDLGFVSSNPTLHVEIIRKKNGFLLGEKGRVCSRSVQSGKERGVPFKHH